MSCVDEEELPTVTAEIGKLSAPSKLFSLIVIFTLERLVSNKMFAASLSSSLSSAQKVPIPREGTPEQVFAGQETRQAGRGFHHC